METLIGIDQNRRLRQLAMFAQSQTESGVLVARPVCMSQDILMEQTSALALAIGVYDIDIPALGAGWLYNIHNITLYYGNGTITLARFMIRRGAISYVLRSIPTLKPYQSMDYTGSMWLNANDIIRANVTVTVAGCNAYLSTTYTRSPYPA